MGENDDNEKQQDQPTMLFVYGTLRPEYTRDVPKHKQLSNPPTVLAGRWLAKGSISNFHLYDVGRYPGVVAVHSDKCIEKSNVVHGDLFSVESIDLTLLDAYEMISQEYQEPYEYRRVVVEVDVDADTRMTKGRGKELGGVKAWLYVYNWPVTQDATWVKSGDYVKYLAAKN